MKFKKPRVLFLLLSFLTFSCLISYSQEDDKISPYASLQYFKDTDNNTLIKATLTYSKNRMELPLPGMKIAFYSGTDNNFLEEVLTDEKGVATFHLKNKSDFHADEYNQWPFSFVYKGNDTIEEAFSEILVRDVTLTMELSEIDSIKTITLKAEKAENGRMVPASDEMVTVYVPRMFSYLPIGEATLDADGNASLEFPGDLPGDKEGIVTVVARFEEHPDFGNIEKRTTLKWGLPSVLPAQVTNRALWTKTAPKWMIYTLSILLTGVWGHYLFALISLIRIKNDAKRIEKEEKYEKEKY